MIGSGKSMRNPSNHSRTHHMSSQPVVIHRKLSFDAPAIQRALRFIVLATNGLWDVLSSKDVVSGCSLRSPNHYIIPRRMDRHFSTPSRCHQIRPRLRLARPMDFRPHLPSYG
ncbi:hypothetical protein C8J56DRAFT_528374 [Mycena floridula]|nr:hypothetical protein C8J56DRAFT_528374 [Mycena floridula]